MTDDLGQTDYELLGIAENVPVELIRSARNGWAKKHHPDSGTDPDPELMKRINAACDRLSDPDARRAYDEELREEREEHAQRERKERADEARRQRARSADQASKVGDAFRAQSQQAGPPGAPPSTPRSRAQSQQAGPAGAPPSTPRSRAQSQQAGPAGAPPRTPRWPPPGPSPTPPSQPRSSPRQATPPPFSSPWASPAGSRSVYTVVYDQTPAVDRNRLTVFLRLIMVIPHAIWSCFYGFAALVVTFIAWFTIISTGRYPDAMYDFVAGFVRFYVRFQGYLYLVTDEFPPFDGGEHPDYPVKVRIPPPPAHLDGVTTALRVFLLIPVYILYYVLSIWMQVVAIAFWFVAVFTGKTAASLIDAVRFPMAYTARAFAYWLLLTDGWPPLND